MNKTRRKQIRDIVGILCDARERLSEILRDEDDARDNMPDSMSDSDNYINSEESSNHIDEAIDLVSEAVGSLEEI